MIDGHIGINIESGYKEVELDVRKQICVLLSVRSPLVHVMFVAGGSRMTRDPGGSVVTPARVPTPHYRSPGNPTQTVTSLRALSAPMDTQPLALIM